MHAFFIFELQKPVFIEPLYSNLRLNYNFFEYSVIYEG